VRPHLGLVAQRVQRLSGVALALFLPLHFWVLAAALEGEAALDARLAFTAHAAVKFAEWGLVLLLAAHLFGGLRVLALEFLTRPARHKRWAAAAAVAALAVSLAFALGL